MAELQSDEFTTVHQGELRGDDNKQMRLQGVLSTDAPLKRINRRCELGLQGQWSRSPRCVKPAVRAAANLN